MDLESALTAFDRTEANLKRLEAVWRQLRERVPEGVAFVTGDTDYEDLSRAFDELASSLPAISGRKIEARPLPLNEIAQNRFDAHELDEVSIYVSVEEAIDAPGHELAEYRYALRLARKKLVRRRFEELFKEVDGAIANLQGRTQRDGSPLADDPAWQKLKAGIGELERLAGGELERRGRWGDLKRHLSFAQGVDLHDIADHDWPSVRPDLEAVVYSDLDPLPVDVADLGALAELSPEGTVTAALDWGSLDDEGFERLIYNLLGDAAGYENPQWLTRTNAPDRGRDLSVERVRADALAGTSRQRVIVQCRHWRARSMSQSDVVVAVEAMRHWEPPKVDVLIIATSGRFTSDAIDWIERRNAERLVPAIEMWPESHLESLIAQRPWLAAASGLRRQ
jgi:hypothetical protein